MNGVSVAGEMKKVKPNIPIILFSAYQSFPGEVIGIAARSRIPRDPFVSRVAEKYPICFSSDDGRNRN
jgi:hypothetical protein